MIFLTRNFAINNIYLYDRKAFIKKNTVFNKIVPDFMDTLYIAKKNGFRIASCLTPLPSFHDEE